MQMRITTVLGTTLLVVTGLSACGGEGNGGGDGESRSAQTACSAWDELRAVDLKFMKDFYSYGEREVADFVDRRNDLEVRVKDDFTRAAKDDPSFAEAQTAAYEYVTIFVDPEQPPDEALVSTIQAACDRL